ncbi:mandelate racemase/muconate lactonizing enzyme family protein [Nocardioides lianchengensis]|uniref:L-alanine-DL-glutamate epimerase n=1 Tax=Nocardioides lianchengensis TaxID=1045774 RepID=A0A1G6TQH1_9ACTN|nr:mandelate racemase/muconate lactonizing enzyme family protein [Nocardioides lianchengensis]NYG11683.1 L-alanine-DL-glutamate epimerase-like enolase superfamily enzyme [Nocardioides lianchengensis]SDD31134.1 L-alanine-DL-glutamate epimerase [Nocardioides lianchengensis]
MRITGYRTLSTLHRWGRPIGDVNGYVESGKTVVPVVLLETDSGLTGVGLGSHTGLDTVFPALEGEDPRATTALYDRMLAWVFKSGHGGVTFGAIGAFDMALWDLKAKAAGQPLWRLLGARDHVVPGYASGLDGPLDDERLLQVQQEFADRGFRAVKLKGGLDIATDIRRLEAVRDLYADAAGGRVPSLMLDANESWSRKEAIRYLHRIEQRVPLAWVEEPVRRWDVEGHAHVVRAVDAAVATGENLTGLEQFRPLIQHAAVDIVQTGSVWGITHFLRVAALAHAFELPVSPVGYNANPLAHAAAAVPNHLATEVQDLGFPEGIRADQHFEDGHLVLGEAPGLGLEVDEAAIAGLGEQADWGLGTGPHVRPHRAGRRLISPEPHLFAPLANGVATTDGSPTL